MGIHFPSWARIILNPAQSTTNPITHLSFSFHSHPPLPFLPIEALTQQCCDKFQGQFSAEAASMRWRRQLSTDPPADTVGDSNFMESWKKTNPNMDPPKTPMAYMAPRPPIPANIPSKLTVNLVLSYDSALAAKEVDMVIIPATTGQMGVLPGHVATIAELKPGVLSVHEGNDVTKYFLSCGFAFIHANSVADIIATEATPVDRIDPNLVQKGLADFQQKLNTSSTDLEKAEAQIGIDVHSALNAALTG